MTIRVVLVRPERAVNVGAVARAMRNAGLDELSLVAPGDWRTLECWRSARGAQELLERAQVHEDLEAALADASWVAGFSRRAVADAARLDVRELAEEVAGLPAGRIASLVFGPERTGLRADELVRCGRRAVIPTHPDQPSLNLSHAVAIAGYEVYRARRRGAAVRTPGVTHADKQTLLELARPGLEAVGALPPKSADSAFRGWQAMVQRADLTRADLRRLQHLARRLKQLGVRPG